MVLNDSVIQGTEQIIETFNSLKEKGYGDTVLLGDQSVCPTDLTPENSETIWELHGWNYVHEFLDSIPKLQPGREYCFYFNVTKEKHHDGLEFPLFMIAAMLPQLEGSDVSIGCSLQHSTDGQNHFSLLCRR